jgi:hypothetical protein
MKTLIQILEEELKSEKHRTIQISELNTPELANQVNAFWLRVENRMREDPAVKRLAELASFSTTILMSAIPREQFSFAFQRLFVEMISIWEDANNRFNEQLKGQPNSETKI